MIIATVPAATTVNAGSSIGVTAPAIAVSNNNNNYRQVKFENALDFLDQVKLQFASQPKVYNQFLDIMKDFKAQW
jgi:paired amphipathic helix protein Sin3a